MSDPQSDPAKQEVPDEAPPEEVQPEEPPPEEAPADDLPPEQEAPPADDNVAPQTADAPTDDAPADDAPIDDAPIDDAPADDAPADAPAQDEQVDSENAPVSAKEASQPAEPKEDSEPKEVSNKDGEAPEEQVEKKDSEHHDSKSESESDDDAPAQPRTFIKPVTQAQTTETKAAPAASDAPQKPTVPLEDTVSKFSFMTFGWLTPLLSKALKAKNLTPNDLHPPHSTMTAEYCGEKFAEAWNRKRWSYMMKKKDELPTVMGTIFNAFLGGGKAWLIMVPFYYAVSLVAPIVIYSMIASIQTANEAQGILKVGTFKTIDEVYNFMGIDPKKDFMKTEYGGIVIAGILLVLQFVYAYMDTIVTTICFRMATQGFNALQDVLYLKMMKIKANNTQMRDVTNLLFTDSFKIQACFQYYPFIILYSLQGLFCIGIIIFHLRVYSVIGIAILIIFFPIIVVVSNRNVTVQRVLLGYRDNRIGKVQEVLQGVKMIKYFRTELVTEQKLANVRKRELKILRKYGMVMIGMNMLSQAANLVMNAVTFSLLAFDLFKNVGWTAKFEPNIIYTTTYLYDYLNNILLMLPLMFSSSLEANISGKRIRAFLQMPEIDQGLFKYIDLDAPNQETGEDEKEDEAGPWGNAKPKEQVDKRELILTIKNVPSFTYSISEDLVIPPVLDTDFALHRDKVQKIIRSYDYFVDMYNNAYETFMDIYFADQKCEAFQQLKADIEILKRGPCFDYFKNVDNNPRKIIIGDHLTFQKRKKLGELDKQKYKRISHELIATLLDTWCLELDVMPISKIENLSLYDATKLTRRFEFDSDLDFLRRMFVNLRIVTPYYMRFKMHVEQEQEDLACSIRDLDINLKRGEIIGVCGSIGAGKSTLFNAILGEMRLERIQRAAIKPHDQVIRFYDKKTYDFVDPNFDLSTLQKAVDKNFKIEVKIEKREDESTSEEQNDEDNEEIPIPSINMYAKKFALFTQNPVIFAGTIRHNIVFYNDFDQEKYSAVCSLCCLLPDFAEWPAGDMFQVGFDGVGLSGGQKARVALARCLYYEPELLLLDDPLSAVDAFVSKQLWQQLIQGYCRYKNMTVLIATHQTQFFGDCDRIFYLENGIILFDGTVEELAEFTGAEADVGQSMDLGAQQKPMDDGQTIKIAKRQPYADFDYQKHCTVEIKSVPPKVNPMIAYMNAPAQTAKLATYKKYFKYGGVLGSVMFMIMLFIQYIGKIFLQVYIGLWTNDFWKFKINGQPNTYIYIYAAVSVATLFLNFFALFTFMVLAVSASKNLHADMTRAIIRTKLSFFDITPNGTIVNKFTKDTESIDVAMMRQVIMVSVNIVGLITLIVVVVLNPASAIVVVPVLIYYFYIFKAFRILTPSLKKLDLVFKGPIISQSNETMRSLPVIRAMKYEKIFSNVFREKINMNVQAQWPSAVCVRWLTYRINVIGVFLSVITCLTALCVSSRFLNSSYEQRVDGKYYPQQFSLAMFSSVSVVYSFGVLQFLVALILAFVQVEAEAVSVERVIEFTILPREGRYKSARELPSDWPKIGGSMEIKNLFFRYRPELPQVLKGLTFNILPYEHVGIVGRTGCAKSTLTMALFRINNPDEGSKLIYDGVNVLDDVGLHASRKGLAIVPQDPFVFSGTLRTTLDKAAEMENEGLTSDEYTKLPDSQMWEVLDRVNLGNYFRKCPGGLDSKITANATNLSSGQKQLLIFAASLISTAFTVVMDEATSQVDKGNDQMVQDIIREQMKNRIIISIAHRLDTVIEFDKIMVMDSGQIIEFDRPAVLLRNKGHFYSLARNTGRDNFRRLKNMALNMEREKYPELGIVDGIDEEFDENQTDDPNNHNADNENQQTNEEKGQNARAGIADLMNRATTDVDDRDNTLASNATVLKAKEVQEKEKSD